MLLLPFVTRPIKIVNVATACTSGINLYTVAGATYPLNLYCFVSNTINSSSSSTPALRTGSSWSNGTWIYIKNSNTITGSQGTSGSGGAGGSGVGQTQGGFSGGPGGTGGVAVLVEGNQFKNYVENGSGSIIAGSGGTGGGGGGGAGGGGRFIPAGKNSPAQTISSGGGGGGAGSPVGAGGPGDSPGNAGEATTGGNGGASPLGAGGPGGNLGLTGSSGSTYIIPASKNSPQQTFPGASGGPAGPTGPTGTSISGSNKITYVSNGTITGPVVN